MNRYELIPNSLNCDDDQWDRSSFCGIVEVCANDPNDARNVCEEKFQITIPIWRATDTPNRTPWKRPSFVEVKLIEEDCCEVRGIIKTTPLSK